ncbi:hypothetical protein K493DRAFT_321674 [Basidiobolus meristosporus CBS 931.73]|uniref:Hemerythrin-like domain-containing protein n=1 Tax=Basidiobolus meristosporus CBS 931.73 TaxID=1314790 RepID=A0A1Y1WQ14_9FUNG|nr:hypothetical protein K493DRAFT_321674 [Basidiobolus meristosporus CBS 931.73]|eukprot:ORX75582.1 hypothetical protein K493DRAFT_321674 [Basidiobolus meristosporus CBS 931.73]
MPQRTLTEAIVHDHSEMNQYFKKYQSLASQPEEQQKWANQIIWEVARHAASEEMILYPTMEEKVANGKKLADIAREQHLQVKKDMYELDSLSTKDVDYDPKFQKMIKELFEHNDEEERLDLAEIDKVLTREESIQLAEQFENTKKISPTRPHPAAPDQPPAATVVNPITAQLDKLRDALRKFPSEEEMTEAMKM